jgi:hypothetical protein
MMKARSVDGGLSFIVSLSTLLCFFRESLSHPWAAPLFKLDTKEPVLLPARARWTSFWITFLDCIGGAFVLPSSGTAVGIPVAAFFSCYSHGQTSSLLIADHPRSGNYSRCQTPKDRTRIVMFSITIPQRDNYFPIKML